jgi:hypothetical protein
MKKRLWRTGIVVVCSLATVGCTVLLQTQQQPPTHKSLQGAGNQSAMTALSRLVVKPAASKTGYSREQFSDGWESVGMCTIRDKILARDMTDVRYRSPADCTVISGTLTEPYTGKTIHFIRGPRTSAAVQIDHVVAVGDAWQTGAQQLSKSQRQQLYNDPLELLAVDGQANDDKSDSDAAGWLPPNKAFDCRYVARQIAVKQKYHLWVTFAESAEMRKTLASCPGQPLPVVGS